VLKVLDLFSGIGGFSIGLERAGMRTVAFCEIDKKAQQVLQKHWPGVPIFNDVSTLTKDALDEKGITVDVICGGFPCQDISLAGRGAGIEGARSGLWFQFHRIIKEVRPHYAIIENVSALRNRGLDQVLRSLAEIGYDAEWHCIPAAAIGAPHRRDRMWIVACPNQQHGWGKQSIPIGSRRGTRDQSGWSSQNVADTSVSGLQRYEWCGSAGTQRISERHLAQCSWWAVEPDVGRVAHGVPGRVDRLKQLGNAVVPQIPEMIGQAIVSREKQYE
jgi:DNA (cytosine-5)-methyltransferase 1